MKSRTILILAMVALMGVFMSSTFAAGPRREPHKAAGAATKIEMFSIVQVGDEIKVIPNSKWTELQRTTNDAFKQELKSYQEEKKEAVKKKEKFDQPKPVKPIVKKIKDRIKNEAQANQEADKLREKLATQKKTHPTNHVKQPTL